MKNRFKLLFTIVAVAFLAASCEDENNLAITAPVGSFSLITPSNGDAVTLSETTPTNSAITLSWAAADFTSQSVVTYTTQIAKDGTNFASIQDLGSTTNRFISIQSAQFNLAALTAGATPFVQSAVAGGRCRSDRRHIDLRWPRWLREAR